MKLAQRMDRLGTENAFIVLDEVNNLVKQGKDIISFCIGEPNFDTPANIKRAAIKAIEDGYTHYSPSAGLPELRKVVADYISETRRIIANPEDVVIAPGGKPIIYYVIHALIDIMMKKY